MLETFAISLLIVAIGMIFLCIRLFFRKAFIHTHVEGNKALGRKGISCIRTQDRMARQENPYSVSEKSIE